MKFLADENIEDEIVVTLRLTGYEILSVKEIAGGVTDDDVLRLAETESALVLTNDKDFGELIFRQKLSSRGVVLLRLGNLSLNEKIEIVNNVIREHEVELENAFTVITGKTVRIRKSF